MSKLIEALELLKEECSKHDNCMSCPLRCLSVGCLLSKVTAPEKWDLEVLFNKKEPERINELCSYCNTEVEIYNRYERQECPECNSTILPCSICTRNTCLQCPLEK